LLLYSYKEAEKRAKWFLWMTWARIVVMEGETPVFTAADDFERQLYSLLQTYLEELKPTGDFRIFQADF